MKSLGAFKTRDGKIYDLIYFSDEGLGQAIGPMIPNTIGTASIAVKVKASSESEAKKLLIEKLAGIELKGLTFFTTTTATDGTRGTTSTTLPPELINVDSNIVNVNASALIVQDNPDLKPIERIIAQHIGSLLSGTSMEEKLDTEVVQKTNKVEINITYIPNYNIGRDAYFGDHVNSMGPITHNVSVVNQTWHELYSKYETDAILSELQKLTEKLPRHTN